MKKEEFIKLYAKNFQKQGFIKKGTNFYKNLHNDILVFYAMQKSNYGSYYYIERGYCIESINQHMPYPKIYEMNISCGRIVINGNTVINYENLDEESFLEEINNDIFNFIRIGNAGKDGLKRLLSDSTNYSYILGELTLECLGIPKGRHNVRPD